MLSKAAHRYAAPSIRVRSSGAKTFGDVAASARLSLMQNRVHSFDLGHVRMTVSPAQVGLVEPLNGLVLERSDQHQYRKCQLKAVWSFYFRGDSVWAFPQDAHICN